VASLLPKSVTYFNSCASALLIFFTSFAALAKLILFFFQVTLIRSDWDERNSSNPTRIFFTYVSYINNTDTIFLDVAGILQKIIAILLPSNKLLHYGHRELWKKLEVTWMFNLGFCKLFKWDEKSFISKSLLQDK